MQRIVTHSGHFHCDELFACATLQLLFGEIPITRTRENLAVHTADPHTAVIDVGAVLDPPMLNFDHHQQEGAGFHSTGIPFASFGLVWARFGHSLIQQLSDQPLSSSQVEELHSRIEGQLVLYVDGVDNGALQTPTTSLNENPTTKINVIDIGRVFLAFSPQDPNDADRAFMDALQLAKRVLSNSILYEIKALCSRALVRSALQNRPHPNILLLPSPCPWVDTALKEGPPDLAFCIFPSQEDDSWLVQQVPLAIGSRKGRASFPKKWCGLNGPELIKACGNKHALFCHRNGFLLRAVDQQSVFDLAIRALATN